MMAFWEERALPAGLVGPVDFWALARLAASFAGEMGILVIDIVPIRAWHGEKGLERGKWRKWMRNMAKIKLEVA